MNLFYLLGSLAGIALLALLCVALFGASGARIAAAHTLEAYLAQILPHFRVRNIALGEDAKAALAENDVDGTIHLVVAHGDGMVARKLSRPLLRAVERNGAVLSLSLADFTLPRAALILPDSAIAAAWEKKLWGL